MSNNLYKDTCRKWYYLCMNNLGHYKSGKVSDDFINIDKWDVFIGGKYINFLVCYYQYSCIKHTLEARGFFFFFLVFFYNKVHLYHAWIWSLLILLVTIMTLQGVVIQWKKKKQYVLCYNSIFYYFFFNCLLYQVQG